MDSAYLHHVSVPTRDLAKAVAFYTEVLDFKPVTRPEFSIRGAWLRLGTAEVHVTDVPQGTFPATRSVGSDDIHFAIRVADFASVVERLSRFGYRHDLLVNDPKRIIIKPQSMAGYSQLYIMDCDFHLIEINAAFKSS